LRYYSLTYTDDMPEGWGGYAKLWFIYLRPKYKEDQGILEHEKCHVRSFYFTLGFHSFLYLCFKAYRLWSEVQAYKIQMKYRPIKESNKELFAKFISEDYGVRVTKEQAIKLLS